MKLYEGSKSLDAEITIDLVEGEVTMDYSLNKHGCVFDSNTSVVLESEWRKRRTLPIAIKRALFWYIVFPAKFAMPFIQTGYTFLHSIGFKKEWQYKYQNFLKWMYSNEYIHEKVVSGEIRSQSITFWMEKNIWMEYTLSEEYSEKIKYIYLLRHFETGYLFGKYREVRQNGWDLVFSFTEPPKRGSCKVRHV